MTPGTSPVIAAWHAIVNSGAAAGLEDILHDDVVFHSPVVHTPQQGKKLTSMYLKGAFRILANGSFRYVREAVGESDAVLEFETEIDGIYVNGVDMIRWDADGKIVDFKVMIRPLKAIELIHRKMADLLSASS